MLATTNMKFQVSTKSTFCLQYLVQTIKEGYAAYCVFCARTSSCKVVTSSENKHITHILKCHSQQLQIKHFSITYFTNIILLKALEVPVKDKAHTCFNLYLLSGPKERTSKFHLFIMECSQNTNQKITQEILCAKVGELVVAVGHPAGGANMALARNCQEAQGQSYVSPCRCGGVAAGCLAF